MGNTSGSIGCGVCVGYRRDGGDDYDQMLCLPQPRRIREFSFAQGGWIWRDEVTIASIVQELRQHPGQFTELYLTNDLPLLTAGPRSLKADCRRITGMEARALGKVMQRDRALQALLLHGVEVTDDAAHALLQTLRGPNAASLQQLSFLSMSMHGASERVLAEVLRKSGWIQHLSLAGSSLSNTGATAIADAIRYNRALETLDLDRVGFSDAGMEQLSRSLASNVVLRTLTVSGNGITDIGAASVAALLRQNRCIDHLDLRGNRITDAGAQTIVTALRANTTLARLDLRGNAVTPDGADELREMTGQCRSSCKLLLQDGCESEIFKHSKSFEEPPSPEPAPPKSDPGSPVAGLEPVASAFPALVVPFFGADRELSSSAALNYEIGRTKPHVVQRFSTCPPSLQASFQPTFQAPTMVECVRQSSGLAGFGAVLPMTARTYESQTQTQFGGVRSPTRTKKFSAGA